MSYGGNADPTGVQVTFLDQTGAKPVQAVIAFSVPVSRIIPNIITKMNLPANSPDGQPMSYSLDHKEGGRQSARELDTDRGGSSKRRSPDRLPRGGGRPGLRSLLSSHPDSSAASFARGCLRDAPGGSRSDPGALVDHVPISSNAVCNDRAALDRLQSESSVFRFSAQGDLPQHSSDALKGTSLVARSRANQNARGSPNRDQAGCVVSPNGTRDLLADADLSPEYFGDWHGVPRWVWHPLGAQCAARRIVHHAVGHGALPQLRHPEPVQPRCGSLGGEPDQVSRSLTDPRSLRDKRIASPGWRREQTLGSARHRDSTGARSHHRPVVGNGLAKALGPGWTHRGDRCANPRVRQSTSWPLRDRRARARVPERPASERRTGAAVEL